MTDTMRPRDYAARILDQMRRNIEAVPEADRGLVKSHLFTAIMHEQKAQDRAAAGVDGVG